MESYIFNLSSTLTYSKKGDFEETGEIEFAEPNMSAFDESTDFSQLMMGSIVSSQKLMGSDEMVKKIQEETENKPFEAPKPDEVKALLFASQEVKVRDIAKSFRKLAGKTATLGTGIKVKDSHLDKISNDDFIDMMCGYASFFTFPFLLKGE